jgi:sulfatase maturation enzyme AslB (radical SAM superfamily)
MNSIQIGGVRQFTKTAINKIYKEISNVGGNALKHTVSICKDCYYHVPAIRYEKNGSVFMCKYCKEHGLSHHMIERDKDFYHSQVYNKGKFFNFDGGTLIEITDRCNLDCPHCYHLPDNKTIDVSREEILDRIRAWPLGANGVDQCILAGAEASLRSDFSELIKDIRGIHTDLRVGIITNGIRFADMDFCKEAQQAGIGGFSLGLNHPSYNGHAKVRQKQLQAITNAHELNYIIGYVSYTMINLSEIDYILNEITSSDWNRVKNFRVRCGSEIGRNATDDQVFVSDIFKEIKQWAEKNSLPFEVVDADNNIYHQMVNLDGRMIRVIQWCDITNIDMEELRSGPWCDFVPNDGLTNFLHQVIRRDVWKNQGKILPDKPPKRYQFNRTPPKDDLNLLDLC